jgi:periplasmic protein TonB
MRCNAKMVLALQRIFLVVLVVGIVADMREILEHRISFTKAISFSIILHLLVLGFICSISDAAFHLRMSGADQARPYSISATIEAKAPSTQTPEVPAASVINSALSLPNADDRVTTPVSAGATSVASLQSTLPNTAPPPKPALLPPAPEYRPRSALETSPKLINEITPVYPDNDELQEGSVVLRLLIDEKGKVDDVAVVRSTPAILFDRSAVNAFQQAQFLPGKYLGIAVKSQLLIEVKFTPYNRGGLVNGRIH